MKKIEDFGEKIGGARKDLWKERGLIVDDILEMNGKEKQTYIKKNNIWKKPNYEQLVADGLPVQVAYYVKKIRDAIPTQPEFSYSASQEEIEQTYQDYVTFVSFLRDEAMNLSSREEAERLYSDVIAPKYIQKSDYSRYVTIVDEAKNFFSNKLLKALQVGSWIYIDSEIKKKQFCYTEEQKILSKYNIFYLGDGSSLSKNDRGDTQLKLKHHWGTSYFYPKDEFADEKKWKEETFFIVQGSKVIANNFESYSDCEKYILEKEKGKEGSKNKTKQTRKKRFVPKQLEHVIRDGVDYRKHRNITGSNYIEEFNFKGGEFGVWMTEKDRQQSLNFGYDALMDLARALEINPKDISLDGRLSIAFGSRGHGNALAHYESLKEVINLTKMRGAGSLAHEWGHALDDFIGKKLGVPMTKGCSMATESSYTKHGLDSLKSLMENMKYKEQEKDGEVYTIKTDFYENSKRFDEFASKTEQGYWSSNCEMFARAFACYVMDKLDNRSDYLCGHANSVIGFTVEKDGNMREIQAYPIGEEREKINQCMDELVRELKEKNILHDFIMELPKEENLPLKTSAEIDYPDLAEDETGSLTLFSMDEELTEGM